MHTTVTLGWILALGLVGLLAPVASWAGPLELRLGLGGGGTVGLPEAKPGFSLDVSGGIGFPLGSGEHLLIKPQLGGTFDFHDATRGWLFAGATLEVSPGKDAMVSTGLETGVVTDFHRVGVRGALRLGLLLDVLSLEFQADGFPGSPDFVVLRGLVGIDFGAALLFATRMASSG